MEDDKKIKKAKDWIKNLEVSTKVESTNKDVLIEYLEQIEVLQNETKILEKQEEEQEKLIRFLLKNMRAGNKYLFPYDWDENRCREFFEAKIN